MKKVYETYQKVAEWICHFTGDKYVHFIVGLLLAYLLVHVGTGWLHSELLPAMFVCFIITAAIGVVKELADYLLKKGFDGVDMMATWVGAALGTLLCLLS